MRPRSLSRSATEQMTFDDPSVNEYLADDNEDVGALSGSYFDDPGDDDELTPGVGMETEDAELHDGVLFRDLPKRTTFYDPVAERQLSQTDAKLFYQMSQSDLASRQVQSPPPREESADLASSLELPQPALGGHPASRSWPGTAGEARASQPSSPIAPPSGKDTAEAVGRLPSSPGADTHGAKQPRIPLGPDLPTSESPFPNASVSMPDMDPHMLSELGTISANIVKVIESRDKYIKLSLQRDGDNPRDTPDWEIYPPPPEPAWVKEAERAGGSTVGSLANSMVVTSDAAEQGRRGPINSAHSPGGKRRATKKRKPGQDIGEDFELDDLLPVPGSCENVFELDENGVYQVYAKTDSKEPTPLVRVPGIREFYMDLDEMLNVCADGPSKSFAFRRLQYLEGQFNMYILLNEYQETADSKRVPHRDFYNVRKVDTHVHHSACMNQKHLLRFIKSKMKKCPDEVVLFRDGRHLTLAEVFQSINLTAYDLSIDTLDMHAHKDSFHRFDKFNLKYNPIGESRLRTIFLKTDNFINGRYLAEITKEVISDLESSKYQMVEWRISIYGKAIDEWDKLAAWVVDNKLFSHNVRWLIQIPRLFDVYKASGLMTTFEELLRNIFQPLYEVTKDPSSHPKLHIFLQRVIGFDSVDDESKVERRLFKKFPVPRVWDFKQNPPYSYWIYYLFANMVSLNQWRQRRGFNTFVLRPHCGEAGDSEHLAVAALCCHSISHGLLLRKVPILQYIFYLEQIGIAMSPLSNNALFLAYERNPFYQYFRRGLNVSLSTDDPLQFAFTKEPLIEEYAVAAQIYKLSSVDMCELAKNSVKQSGFEDSIKRQWLGPNYLKPGRAGNLMVKTNIPDRREEFRHTVLLEEKELLAKYIAATGGPSLVNSPRPAHQANPGSFQNKEGLGGAGLSSTAPQPPLVESPEWSTERLGEPGIFPGIISRGQRTGTSKGDEGARAVKSPILR